MRYRPQSMHLGPLSEYEVSEKFYMKLCKDLLVQVIANVEN